MMANDAKGAEGLRKGQFSDGFGAARSEASVT
jgi:hypothetical protein